MIFRRAYAGHAHDDVSRYQLRPDVVLVQFLFKLRSVEAGGAHIQIYLGPVQIRMPEHLKPRHLSAPFVEPVHCHVPLPYGFSPLLFHEYLRIYVQAQHQKIGGAGGFQYLEIVFQCRQVHPVSHDVKDRSLGQGSQGLMGGIDHHVCPAGFGGDRVTQALLFHEYKVGTVGLIHYQSRSVFMAYFAYG